MKPSGRNLNLTSYDEIFQTEETRIEASQEKVINIPLAQLHPFKNHPFKVTDDESMLETAESITKHGVLVPVIARPREEGGYELISGHRRKRASELAGKETLPCIVRNLDDDAATIIMVDSNIQRENILPCERAFAYKLKLDAIRRQAGKYLMCIYDTGTRSGLIAGLEKIALELAPDDAELSELIQSAFKKLTAMSDQEYGELILVPDYKEEDD